MIDLVATPPDPVAFQETCWPKVTFYDKQWDVIYSVLENDETVVPAGNMLGKDYVAGFIAVYFFLTRYPCRIVTTSAKEDHLRVLWGEIGRFVSTCKFPLDYRKGGPLVLNHQDIRRIYKGEKCSLSYMLGMVANPDTIAAMQGHHVAKTGDGIPRTLFMSDESSSVPDEYYEKADTWANRKYIFGNTWPCTNFFYRAVEGSPDGRDPGGDVPRPDGKGYHRKVIKIRAVDSPNIKVALKQRAMGLEPTGEMVIDGVKDWEEYQRNLRMWDNVQKCVSLDAEFYKGGEVLLFPPEWLNHANKLADSLIAQGKRRKARAIGVDPAEGGDESSWSVVDEYGLIEQVNLKTPDTTVVPARTLALMEKYKVPAKMVAFDRGGGGKEHADYLRSKGHNVVTVAFGETPNDDPRRGVTPVRHRLELKEDRYAYVNRRAEMYGTLRELLNPAKERFALVPSVYTDSAASRGNPEVIHGFAVPAACSELRRQLAPIPLSFDAEGRLKLPPKNKRSPDSKEVTLTELIGCSPDRADSLVLAVHAMTRWTGAVEVGVY